VTVLVAALVVLLVSYVAVCRYYEARADAKLRQLKAAGLPTRGVDLQPPPVPEAENAAPLYAKAADMVEPEGGGGIPPPDAYTARPPLTQADLEALTDFVGHFPEASALVREATGRSKCRFDTDWSDPAAALFPHLNGVRVVAQFTAAEAMVQSHRGEQARAVDRLRMGFVLSRHVSSEACLLDVLMGCAMDAMMLRAADDVVRQRPVPPREARAFAEELVRLDYSEWMTRAMRAERVVGISMFRHLRAGDRDYVGLLPSPERALWWVHSRAFPAWRCADELYYLDAMDDCQRVAALTGKQRAADPAVQRLARPYPRCPLWAIASGVASTPSYGAFRRADVAAAGRGLLAAALGLEVYRRQYGRYPRQLAGLRAIRWPMAKDVLSNEDFVYRRTEGGFLLYSIGPDLIDNGGHPVSDMAKVWDEKNVDIVWTATGR
jgi:hypothetical protein